MRGGRVPNDRPVGDVRGDARVSGLRGPRYQDRVGRTWATRAGAGGARVAHESSDWARASSGARGQARLKLVMTMPVLWLPDANCRRCSGCSRPACSRIAASYRLGRLRPRQGWTCCAHSAAARGRRSSSRLVRGRLAISPRTRIVGARGHEPGVIYRRVRTVEGVEVLADLSVEWSGDDDGVLL